MTDVPDTNNNINNEVNVDDDNDMRDVKTSDDNNNDMCDVVENNSKLNMDNEKHKNDIYFEKLKEHRENRIDNLGLNTYEKVNERISKKEEEKMLFQLQKRKSNREQKLSQRRNN